MADEYTKVTDYDFMFASGLVIPITVDPRYDSITFEDNTIVVIQGPKPSLSNPKEYTTAETIYIARQHLAVFYSRERQVRTITPEEQEQMRASLQYASSNGFKGLPDA